MHVDVLVVLPCISYVRGGWALRAHPSKKIMSINYEHPMFKGVDVVPRPCHADAHVQTYVHIPDAAVYRFPHARVRI